MNVELLIGAILVAVSLGGTLIIAFRNITRSRGTTRSYALRACFYLFVMVAAFIASIWYIESPWRFIAAACWLILITVSHYRFIVRYQIMMMRDEEDEEGPR